MSSKSCRKGIILAGGTGSRLAPITKVISKQLLHVYDKPMIYYPLTTLMLAGIRDILIIVNPNELNLFQKLLDDGKEWGLNISYAIQEHPRGIGEAFLIAEDFLNKSPSALILGDNLFYGDRLSTLLQENNADISGAKVFAYPVSDPQRYGVVEFDSNRNVLSIEEKPTHPKSNFSITGIYFYDSTAVEKAKRLKPSNRNELEITDINKMYLEEQQLKVEIFGRGFAWLDTGTWDSLHDAATFIRTLENRQGLKIGCPEEIAWRMNWINDKQLINLSKQTLQSGYGKYLLDIIKL